MSRRRILVDVDGVLADFTAGTIKLIEEKLGEKRDYEQVTQWDVFESFGLKEHEHLLEHAIEHEGFCKSLPPVAGAKDAVELIEKEFGNVYAVTSPHHVSTWPGQRSEWLIEHMNIPRERQVHTKAKHIVAGCVLIDDSGRNLKEWVSHWPDGLPILVDHPWNRFDAGFCRVHSWDDVFDRIEDHFTRKTTKSFV